MPLSSPVPYRSVHAKSHGILEGEIERFNGCPIQEPGPATKKELADSINSNIDAA